MDFGSIKPVTLATADVSDYSQELAQVSQFLRDQAIRQYGSPKMKRFRREYIKIGVSFRVHLAWAQLFALESLFIGAYIKEIAKLANSFWYTHRNNQPHLSEDDYLQHANLAFTSAAMTYTGKTMFSTYVYWVVKNSLVDFVRKQKQKKQAQNQANLGDGDETIEDKRRSEHWGDPELLHIAVNQAPLSEMERKVVQRFLSNSDSVIQNQQGEPLDRHSLQSILYRACGKIKVVYKRLAA